MDTAASIDIIIPVFNALSEVQACINSVLSVTSAPYALLVIDDASPDPRIWPYLQQLQQQHACIEVLRNETNLGFVGTVNRAMSLSKSDVVLLNSDTIVTRGWLEKLSVCAQSDPGIGTITPFSNNAEICSFPVFCQDNPVPEQPQLVADSIADSQPCYPEIPTAVGFCMYIRRTLLDAIGLFNAEAFGKGYGEENDFCRRALPAGFRNVLCDDAYVVHLGSCSFGDDKAAHCKRNMQVLLGLHPDYLDVVMAFIERDPIQPIRAAALERLNQTQAAQPINTTATTIDNKTDNTVTQAVTQENSRKSTSLIARLRHWMKRAS